jgi:hypothetical protein
MRFYLEKRPVRRSGVGRNAARCLCHAVPAQCHCKSTQRFGGADIAENVLIRPRHWARL